MDTIDTVVDVHSENNDIEPEFDGVNFINIYTRGTTKLGQWLSNLAPIGFKHPKYGEFQSVEAFWYWAGTGKQHVHLKKLHGYAAKQEGKKYERVPDPDFLKEVEEAIRCKIEQNDWLRTALIESDLPFEHYYLYKGHNGTYKLIKSKHRDFIVNLFTKLREELKMAPRVIIAGSRGIEDYYRILSAVSESKFKIGTVVSGTARGVDRLGEQYARDNDLKIARFPADWNEHGKAAGFIRNEAMAKYADKLIAIWDGKSPGTKHMIDIMRNREKPVYIHLVR